MPPTPHAGERAIRVRILVWALGVGVVFGVVLTNLVSPRVGLVAGSAAFGAVALGVPLLVHVAGGTVRAFVQPSGASTPPRPDYSRVDALLIRDRVAEAARLLEDATIDRPQDPEPYLRRARVARDHERDPSLARHWFDLALATQDATPAQRAAIRRELEELPRT